MGPCHKPERGICRSTQRLAWPYTKFFVPVTKCVQNNTEKAIRAYEVRDISTGQPACVVCLYPWTEISQILALPLSSPIVIYNKNCEKIYICHKSHKYCTHTHAHDTHHKNVLRLNLCISLFCSKVAKPLNATQDYVKAHSQTFKYIVLGILGAGYVAYFIAACVLDFQRATALVVLTCLAVVIQILGLLYEYKGESIRSCFEPVLGCFQSNLKWIKWVFILVITVLLIVWLAVDTSKRPEQLISFGGVCMFIIVIYIFSAHRSEVKWRPVFWGLGLQFCIGLFVIRTQPGFAAFEWLGEQVKIFLDYTKAGSRFVFGDLIDIFAFQALPIIVFFSSVMSILYFLGVMQWLILKISWVLQITMGTSPTETLSVAGNIFVGQTEAPLLIRPYLKDMTKSEIHAVMTGDFPITILHFAIVCAKCITFLLHKSFLVQIDASALIAASVMAAPCALAFSKLSFPETEKSVSKSKQNIKMDCGYGNILEAASNGASASIGLCANIAANLIAFLAILEFINKSFSWFGGMVGYPHSHSRLVRSETITTYALCGFANLSSLGIVIGGLSSICPTRKSDISAIVLRAMLTGTCVTMVNACIAGILFVPPLDCVNVFQNNNHFNASSSDITSCCQDLFKSTVNNGTLTFNGIWNNVENATLYFTQCCQCCSVSFEALCQ
uniref:Solute carrier family 28 member 1 n=1 Tax=Neogobius melanostomus TaxID=47308 RepID=A0A8C6WNV9_9GOBI